MIKNFELIIPTINPTVEIVTTKDMGIICFQKEYNYRIRLNQITFELICLIDGKKSIQQLTKEFNDSKGENLSTNTIFEFLDGNLKKYGIIDLRDGYSVNRSTPSYLRLHINLISNRYSSLICRYLKCLFGKKYFWPAFILQSIIVYSYFIIYSKEMYFQLENITLIDAISVFLLMGIALFIHELGHVSACDRYGAHYGSIGFGFYLFAPVMFADVSDIWRLPKYQRIIVNLSGIYMGNYMAFAAFFIYLFSNKLIFLYFFSLQCIESLYNLNPLVKYDGYWIVSDLFNIPNLSKTAHSTLKNFSWNKINTYTIKEWMLIFYGIVSPLFVLTYIFTIIIMDPESIIYFPIDFYHYIIRIILDIRSLNLLEFARYSPSIAFYFLLFRLIYYIIRKS